MTFVAQKGCYYNPVEGQILQKTTMLLGLGPVAQSRDCAAVRSQPPPSCGLRVFVTAKLTYQKSFLIDEWQWTNVLHYQLDDLRQAMETLETLRKKPNGLIGGSWENTEDSSASTSISIGNLRSQSHRQTTAGPTGSRWKKKL